MTEDKDLANKALNYVITHGNKMYFVERLVSYCQSLDKGVSINKVYVAFGAIFLIISVITFNLTGIQSNHHFDKGTNNAVKNL